MKKKIIISKDDLYHQYIVLKKTQNQCAKYFNCSEKTIFRKIKDFNIKKQKGKIKIDIPKDELYNQYITLNKTRKECADFFNTTERTIKRRISEYNIKKEKTKRLENVEKSILEKYGKNHYLQTPEMKKQVIKKYGVKNYNQQHIKNYDIWKKDELLVDWIKSQSKKNNRKLLYKEIYDFFNISNTALGDRLKNIKYDLNKHILKNPNSVKEEIISNWLLKNNIKFKKNNRAVITPYELDFVIEDKKIAIEMNDTWTHSIEYMTRKDGKNYHLSQAKNYHNMKTELCEEKGYRLIHIFEKDLNDLDNILGILINTNKLNARDLTYKHDYDVKDFIIENHQQHTCNKRNGGALIDKNNSIVGAITFRKNKNNLELDKLCFKMGYNVRGGASKLFKNYLKNIDLDEYENIITFCDTTYHTGNVYEKLGFKIDKIINPIYYWVKNDEWNHRRNFQKKLLQKRFNLDHEYINSYTEREICNDLGYVSIYGSNNIRYIYKL